jgi:Type IV secretion system pilin
MFSKNTFAKIALGIILISSVAFPFIASAYTTPNLWGNPPGFWGPLVSCTGNYLSQNGDGSTPTPCTNLCNLIGTIINIIYFALSIAIFIVAPISLIAGGIMIMLAGANPEMLGRGKKVLTSAVVGLVIVMCSYLIVNTALVAFGITAVGGFNGNSSVCSTNS